MQYIVYIAHRYRVAEALPLSALSADSLSALQRHSGRLHSMGVVLRDGLTGRRYTLGSLSAVLGQRAPYSA